MVSRSTLDLVTDVAAREQDIRVGIELVRIAARRAENAGRSTVTRKDVMDAFRVIIAPALQIQAANLSEGERVLLSRIAELARDTDLDMTAGAVYEAAQEYLPIGKTTYHTRLRRLEEAGVVDLLLRTDRGRTREIVLRYDPDEVLAACSLPGETKHA